ncbi:phosphoglycerate kinase [Candidatus Woesearchaeota archaeon]|nr:phosphoglycerate kinase [Candidatus Woesearchaeota archaeon]
MKTVEDFDFSGKRVLLRVDFNVTLDEEGNVSDDSRIMAALPTIRHILEHRPRQLIIMSHLGDPEGPETRFSMDKVSERLIQLLGKSVYKTKDAVVQRMPGEGLVLLENLRFHKEEKADDEEFAKKLASYADVYVNDAFGVCHRKHASVHAITKFLPSCAGLLIKKELENLDIDRMPKPIFAILGGGKLGTKIPLIQRLLVNTDKVIVGGGMIFTFYKAQKYEIGESVVDKSYLKNAEVMCHNEKLYLPEDVVVADCESKTEVRTVAAGSIPKKSVGLDIGAKSVKQIKKMLKGARTVLWNGPLGYYEKPPFDKATREIANFIAGLDCNKVVGGGDTADIIHKMELEGKYSFISSGGGAALEVLSGNALPALEALEINVGAKAEVKGAQGK